MTHENLVRVAVVIPCFNDGPTLAEAVASALNQEDCEVVVIDDGSTDSETHRAFASVESDRVRVLHQPNQGLAAARMAGVRATTARYVFALDADDYLVPGALTVLADELDAHQDLGLVWGRYRFVGDKTHERETAELLDPWQITYFNDLPVASMIRRQALLAVGGWQLPNGYEDLDLWMAFAERGVRGRGVRAIVYRHRIHGARMAVGCIPRHAELCAVLRSRHAQLFEARRQNRRRSPAPAVAKVVIPLIDLLTPVSEYRRTALMGHVYCMADRRRRSRYIRAAKRRLQVLGSWAGPFTLRAAEDRRGREPKVGSRERHGTIVKPPLIVIGPTPPPYHGVTVSTELVLANPLLMDHFDVRHVDTSDPRGLETIGRWDAQNALGALRSIVRLAGALGGRRGVVYLPLSQSRGGFVRDSVFITVAAWRKWKIAVHLHGSELGRFYSEQPWAARWYIRKTLRKVDSIAVLGSSLRRVVGDLFPDDRVAVIPNGTPAPDADVSGHDRQLGVFLGNLLRRKGVIEAVSAATLVATLEPCARFLFVGEWEDESLEREARGLATAAGAQIQFQDVTVGRQKSRLLSRAGFLLFPPVRPEGHPRVIVEALAAGLPVVTTDQGAIADTVVHGDSGFVLDNANPEALAEVMLGLIRDAALWTRMSAAARRRYDALYTQEAADRRIAEWLAGLV